MLHMITFWSSYSKTCDAKPVPLDDFCPSQPQRMTNSYNLATSTFNEEGQISILRLEALIVEKKHV